MDILIETLVPHLTLNPLPGGQPSTHCQKTEWVSFTTLSISSSFGLRRREISQLPRVIRDGNKITWRTWIKFHKFFEDSQDYKPYTSHNDHLLASYCLNSTAQSIRAKRHYGKAGWLTTFWGELLTSKSGFISKPIDNVVYNLNKIILSSSMEFLKKI